MKYTHIDLSEFSGNTISGWLNEAEEYQQIKPIFERWSEMLERKEVEEVEWQPLLSELKDLKVTLIDVTTGEKVEVWPVTVSENLLFTCGFE